MKKVFSECETSEQFRELMESIPGDESPIHKWFNNQVGTPYRKLHRLGKDSEPVPCLITLMDMDTTGAHTYQVQALYGPGF